MTHKGVRKNSQWLPGTFDTASGAIRAPSIAHLGAKKYLTYPMCTYTKQSITFGTPTYQCKTTDTIIHKWQNSYRVT